MIHFDVQPPENKPDSLWIQRHAEGRQAHKTFHTSCFCFVLCSANTFPFFKYQFFYFYRRPYTLGRAYRWTKGTPLVEKVKSSKKKQQKQNKTKKNYFCKTNDLFYLTILNLCDSMWFEKYCPCCFRKYSKEKCSSYRSYINMLSFGAILLDILDRRGALLHINRCHRHRAYLTPS